MSSGTSDRTRAGELRRDAVVRRRTSTSVSRSAGIRPRSSSSGGRRPDISRRRLSASSDSSLAHLREHVDALVDLAGLEHQQHRLERERGGRDPLDRAVVEVARDPVALGLDRRVRPPQDAACGPRRGPAGTGTASGSSGRPRARRSRRARAGALGRIASGSSRSATRGRPALPSRRSVPLAGHRQGANDSSAPSIVRGERRSTAAPSTGPSRELDHPAERVVGAEDHVAVVELDDPVDGGLEDQAQALLGLAQRRVGARSLSERLSVSLERLLLLLVAARRLRARLGSRTWFTRMRTADRRGEEPDQQRAPAPVDALVDLGRSRPAPRATHAAATAAVVSIGAATTGRARERGARRRRRRERA